MLSHSEKLQDNCNKSRIEFEKYIKAHGIPDRIEILVCDLNGIFRGKWLPGNAWQKLLNGSVRLPLSTYTPTIYGEEVPENNLGEVVGDPDGRLYPIPDTLVPVPWSKVHCVQVMADIYDDDDLISPHSPRLLLDNVLDRYHAVGLRPVIAVELEFYLFNKRENSSEPPQPLDRTPRAQNFDIELLGRLEPVLNSILDFCKKQDLPTDALIAEFGPGQFEINFHHGENVLAIAETALYFRRLVRSTALLHGFEASFMAKPYADEPGNGKHVHLSILDKDGQNIFTPKNGEPISDTLKAAVKGALKHMRDSQLLFAPHLNSYRRFTSSNFSPTSPTWGENHRGSGIRLPDTEGPAARLEHRISGADANPYLAIAAVLGAVLEGIQAGDTQLPLPVTDDNFTQPEPLSHDWGWAIEQFENSDFISRLFGREYQDIFATVKRAESQVIGKAITPQELRHYLSRL